MAPFNFILTAATLATLAAASPTGIPLKSRQQDCQGVRNAISANGWPCTEIDAPSCEFCCEEWLDLSVAFGGQLQRHTKVAGDSRRSGGTREESEGASAEVAGPGTSDGMPESKCYSLRVSAGQSAQQ
ncbi:hypothetical protein VTI74DRAFT_4425 [Chaetomium olivicolor]